MLWIPKGLGQRRELNKWKLRLTTGETRISCLANGGWQHHPSVKSSMIKIISIGKFVIPAFQPSGINVEGTLHGDSPPELLKKVYITKEDSAKEISYFQMITLMLQSDEFCGHTFLLEHGREHTHNSDFTMSLLTIILLCFILCRLIAEMENYSWSLGNNSVVNPNIAVQSVPLHPKDTGGSTGVLFTVKRGELFVFCACNTREHSATNHK